jgi:hypothetical protein
MPAMVQASCTSSSRPETDAPPPGRVVAVPLALHDDHAKPRLARIRSWRQRRAVRRPRMDRQRREPRPAPTQTAGARRVSDRPVPARTDRADSSAPCRVRYRAGWPTLRRRTQPRGATQADHRPNLEAGTRGGVHRGGSRLAFGEAALRPAARGGVDVAQRGSTADTSRRVGGAVGGGAAPDLRQVPRRRPGAPSPTGTGRARPPADLARGPRRNFGMYSARTADDGRTKPGTTGQSATRTPPFPLVSGGV